MEAGLGDALGRARHRLRDGRQGPDRLGQAVGRDRRALGGQPPEGFNYELFLDEKGQKISKSKGNGLTIDEWLRYASPESLSLFMYQKPKAAKRLYFDVIPRAVDEYQQFLDAYPRQEGKQRLGNPVWHIHSGKPPKPDMPVTFALLLTLVSSSNAENAETLWGFIGRYRPGVTPQTHPKLDALVGYAINYYRDFVRADEEVPRADDERAQGAARICATRCRTCRRMRRPRTSRTSSTRSGGASRSSTR